ncbi:MAG: DUF2785 domain-containing protein [Planctomycetes bacterium]|nr:DUF2785 domain-containing protein [Planctomycetota bacterium]
MSLSHLLVLSLASTHAALPVVGRHASLDPTTTIAGPVLAPRTQSSASTRPIEPDDAARELAWLRSLQGGEYALPADVAPAQVLARVRKALGATDPALRDDVTYDLMRHWLFPKARFDDAVLREHATALITQLAVPSSAPAPGDESVLLRSFSALHLSLLAASDLQRPFLDDAGWRALLDAALAYLAAERDVRGWVDGTGWHHSVAHTADLLKFLARSPRFQPDDEARVLSAVETKLAAVPTVLAWGEDERLAAVLASLVKRADFDAAPFDAWLARERTRRAAVWSAQPFDPARFVTAQNARNVLASLHLALSSVAEPTPTIDAAKKALLDALRG